MYRKYNDGGLNKWFLVEGFRLDIVFLCGLIGECINM